MFGKVDYERAIELDETNAEAYLGLADVCIRQGNYEKALEILRRGLEKTENHQDIADKIAGIEDGNITDSSGNVRRMTMYGPAGELVFRHDYTYNVQGQRDSVTSYNAAGNQTGYLELTYTADG